MTLPLATVAQVSSALGLGEDGLESDDPTALLWLAAVSEAVRNFTGQHITKVTDDIEYQTLQRGQIAPRQFPVVSVSKVETMASDGSWSIVPTGSWRLLPSTGAIVASRQSWGSSSWPCGEDEIRITYTHGLDTPPAGLAAVVAHGAAGMYNTPAGIVSDRVGQRSATYQASDIFSPLELIIIGSYREARTA